MKLINYYWIVILLKKVLRGKKILHIWLLSWEDWNLRSNSIDYIRTSFQSSKSYYLIVDINISLGLLL